MTQPALKNMIFLLFDAHLLSQVVEVYEKYDYLVEDDDIKLAYFISKIYTSTEQKVIIEAIKEIQKCKESETFPNIKALACKLILNANSNNLIEYAKMTILFKKEELDAVIAEEPVVYNSPCIEQITINSNKQDEQKILINKCKTYLGDKAIFRNNIDKIEVPSFKYMLKLRHSMQTLDYEYGFNAARNLIELFYINKIDKEMTKENYKEIASDYITLIEFFASFQVLNYKITNLPEYFKLKNMFKGVDLSLTIDSFLILETDKKTVLQAIAETKKYLKENNVYTEDELSEYLKPILERIKDNQPN